MRSNIALLAILGTAIVIGQPLLADGISNPGSSSSGGGSGTVTSVAAGCATSASPSPITTTGTIATQELVNSQTGSNYAILNSDCGKLVDLSNSAPQTPTIAQAGSGGNFASGWYTDVCNVAAGTQTLTPATSTINGAATLAIKQNQCFRVVSDGSNYQLATQSAGTPCTTLAAAVQYNNSGVFGCAPFVISSGQFMPSPDPGANTRVISVGSLGGGIGTAGGGGGASGLRFFGDNSVSFGACDVQATGYDCFFGNGLDAGGTEIHWGANAGSTDIGMARNGTNTLEINKGVSSFHSGTLGDLIKRNDISSGYVMVGSATALTLNAGETGLAKITASGSAPGAAGGKFELVCGTNSGTAKMIMYAGTSTTPVTMVDNVGAGVTGC